MAGAGQSAHDLAILFDDVREDFDAAVRELSHLEKALPAGRDRSIDLIFLPPSSLFCRLRLGGGAAGGGRLIVAQTAIYRVLNLMALSDTERERFVSSRLLRSTWSALAVEDTAAAMTELRGELAHEPESHSDRRLRDRSDLALPVRVELCIMSCVGLARSISGAGLFIECEALPAPGDAALVTFETTVGRAPSQLPARVSYVLDPEAAAANDRAPGFGAEFRLDSQERAIVDSFLAAAAHGRPWPERSGRLHSRFDLGLRAMFVHAGTTHDVSTGDVSRGGALLMATPPPPVGADLLIILYHPGSAGRAKLKGRVVRHAASGAGVRFDEPNVDVEQKLRDIVSATEVAVAKSAMLVDADSFCRTALGNVLRPAGFEILEARDADEGFGHVLDRLSRIDVVLIDLLVGGMGLRDLVERILNLAGASPPLLIVVADSLEDVDTKALKGIGIDAVLLKSTPAEEILRRIGDLMATAKSLTR
jgi:CheY-like chemotaxis protein